MSVIVTGASGFLGRALTRRLGELGIDTVALSSRDADLRDPQSLEKFSGQKYDYVFHLAAWTQAGEFSLYHPGEEWLMNQQINTTVLRWWATRQPQAKLISIGTSCTYEPGGDLREENYLVGTPIESLYTYAMTKRMLLIGQMSLSKQFGLNWLTVVASTLYGPDYHVGTKQMHFIFDLAWKILNFKYNGEPIILWGDGYQRRELVHVDDFVNEALQLNEMVDNTVVNIGAGEDYTIREFAAMICECAGVDPEVIEYDTSRYVGSRSKCLNVEKLDQLLPNRSRIPIREGLYELVSELDSTFKSSDMRQPPGPAESPFENHYALRGGLIQNIWTQPRLGT